MEKQKDIEKQKPLISVVMLNWNGLHYLKRTVPVILRLNYANYEFIIVDNGSNDGSVKWLRNFKEIKIIKNKENLGYSRGKNLGIKEARGEYILSLDNDILISSNTDFIDSLLSYYYNYKDVGFLMIPLINTGSLKTDYYGIFFSLYGYYAHKKEVYLKDILRKGRLYPIAAFIGGAFFIKKDIWDIIGGFDESQSFNLDDVDAGPRAYIYGYKNYLVGDINAVHLGINKTKKSIDYADRFTTLFSGHARSMIKNYRYKNLILRFPIFCSFQFLKAIRYSFKKRSFKVFCAFLLSIKAFLKNLPDTFEQRRIIQSKRVVKEDVFLKIKPPMFNQ